MRFEYTQGRTIAAIATPPGEGGVAIIRISGPEAVSIADQIFSGKIASYKSHTAHLGNVVAADGTFIDQALALVFLGRRSYTGENTVEFQCHGGNLVSKRILEAAIQAGAEAALPGEFTFKAFMNGKIDLAKAEAIQELIHAKNDKALDAAEKQLQGRLSREIASFQKELTDIAAILEAWVDFPEEGLEFASMDEVIATLEKVIEKMKTLKETFHEGRLISLGISLCLVGAPNVGKSSLMNALLDKERAIVTSIAGTTRDLVEDDLQINGLNFRLTDTAGIREVEEVIEKEGIRRSRHAMLNSDLVLLVLDVTEGLKPQDKALINEIPQEKTIVVWNKKDLSHAAPPALPLTHVVALSAKERQGLQELKQTINEVLWKKGAPEKDEIIITKERHKLALEKSLHHIEQVLDGLKTGISPEFISLEMRLSLVHLGSIIGKDITEEILSSIFSKFCIGK